MTTPAASDANEPPENLQLEESASFDSRIIHYIQRAAATAAASAHG